MINWDKIEKEVTKILDEEGFHLVRMKYFKSKKFQIMAERHDGTMTSRDCAFLSKRLYDIFDDFFPDDAEMEISSPGIDRPLITIEDFQKWQNFEIFVEFIEMIDGCRKTKATLTKTEDKKIYLLKDNTEIIADFDNIKNAKLVINDMLLDQHKKNNL